MDATSHVTSPMTRIQIRHPYAIAIALMIAGFSANIASVQSNWGKGGLIGLR